MPAFCRVAARLAPTPDSDIKIEVWLPVSGWNGKLLAVGNGGWAGSINYNGMTAALENGYATTSTDTGHTGGNASFVIGHPEKVIDFAYRAVHEMAVSVEGDDDRVLQGRAAALVLDRLLDRRTAGADCGAALSRRLRWDHRGSAGEQSDSLVCVAHRLEAKIFKDPAKVVPQAKLALVNRAVTRQRAMRSTESPTAC